MADCAPKEAAAKIAENIAKVKERIAIAAGRSGRDATSVTLVAVSKTRTSDEVEAAIIAGADDFGENKVQEIMDKYDILRVFTENSTKNRNIRWHMIGHLQRNKVKYIADRVDLIHSVDSLRLAEEINMRVGSLGRTMDVLLQVNAAGEESKFGIAPDKTRRLVSDIVERCDNVRIRGLMTIAPIADDPEDVRGFFSEVRTLHEIIAREDSCEKLDMKWLSMGMTHDFEVAIEEGANLVRIGTGIFGSRIYV